MRKFAATINGKRKHYSNIEPYVMGHEISITCEQTFFVVAEYMGEQKTWIAEDSPLIKGVDELFRYHKDLNPGLRQLPMLILPVGGREILTYTTITA